MHFAQFAEHLCRIREVRGELLRPHALHPVEVEDQIVERDLQFAIFRSDGEHFLLRVVLEARLPESVGPQRQQRRGSRQLAV